jgi:two-component system, NtrC family, nitrogen regulation response regulator GlnG
VPNESEALRLWLQADTRGGSSGVGVDVTSLRVPGLTVLAHPDMERVGERALLTGVAAGRVETLSRGEPGFLAPRGGRVRPLADPFLSRRPLRLSAGPEPGSILLDCREASSAVTVGGAAAASQLLFSAAEVERGVVLLLGRRVALVLSLHFAVGQDALPSFGLVGDSAALEQLRREIRRIAPLDVPVLLRGETGTGKELVAQALHQASPRRARPFLATNLGALPPTLAAAELFGAARGAYTGADRSRDGTFQRADGGTLFLDEVGETPLAVQALLLRALETQEIQPVGSAEARRVNVRLIAATDADLERAVQDGEMRAPFLHRLAGCVIRLPSLRQRRDDFGRLFCHFLRADLAGWGELERLATPPDGRPWVPAGLIARLAELPWPGNVRQLRSAVRQLAIAGRDAGERGMWLQAETLCAEAAAAATTAGAAQAAGTAPTARSVQGGARRKPPEEVTDEELIAALRTHRFNIQRAADHLGMSRSSVYNRIERCPRIRKATDLTREEIQACRERCGGDLDAMVAVFEVSKRGLQRWMTQLGMS